MYSSLPGLDLATLAPSDLEMLADAAWWVCLPRESIDLRQRAYVGFADAGRDQEAGAAAARLAVDHFGRGMMAVGGGWLSKAHRHLDDGPSSRAQMLLWTIESTVRRYSGDVDEALDLARRASGVAADLGDRGGHAVAIHAEGMALVASGRVSDGLRLLDEAMTSVLAGELDAFLTGVVYCNVIGMCLEVADIRRASEWSVAATDWCESLAVTAPFTSLCRVNRAHVARLSGSWDEAEADAVRAAEELARFDDGEAAAAFAELGEIRRRRGDLEGAADAYERARSLGRDPEPGPALLALATGRVDAARAALRIARQAPGLPIERSRVMAASVEVALAAGDLEEASSLADDLRSLASSTQAAVLEASSMTADGAVELARGDAGTAVGLLRRACATWSELRLPYEHARARLLAGRALLATDDEVGARREIGAARETFARLGAALDDSEAAAALGDGPARPGGLTEREVEVLRLVASGMTNRDIAVELVLSEHTVGRHLQNIYAKIDVSSRAAATAFAFEHDLA